MNELERFEAELHALRPAPLPASLRVRLMAVCARPAQNAPEPVPVPLWWRWLFPLAATAGLALLVGFGLHSGASGPSSRLAADEVEIGQTLVSSFDTIARLPDGRPVRVRCEEWVDELVLRNSARGLCVQEQRPRLEVFPVRFETY